jgi:hypothetical protein
MTVLSKKSKEEYEKLVRVHTKTNLYFFKFN